MGSIKPVHYRDLCKVFEREGWTFIRQKGDHMIYKKAGALRAVVIPRWKSIPQFVILNNLHTANISRERYFELIAKTHA